MVLKQISSFTFRTSTQGCLWLLCSQASTWPEINGKRTYMSVKNNAQGVFPCQRYASLPLFSSVQSLSHVHESQHARPPCPSPTPGVHWDSCPLSRWCHPAISFSVVPFSSCPQSLPASESFPGRFRWLEGTQGSCMWWGDTSSWQLSEHWSNKYVSDDDNKNNNNKH